MKVAVFGSTGFLGKNLIELYSNLGHDVVGVSRRSVMALNKGKARNVVLDFNNLIIHALFSFDTKLNWRPDVIINCVAETNLQACEDNYHLAYYSNVSVAKDLAHLSNSIGAYYVHVSTDHYYSDGKERHTEKDPVVLSNNYAKTKYISERVVLSEYDNSIVVRTNIIGFKNGDGSVFFEWLIEKMKQKKACLYNNYITSSISVHAFGEILLLCIVKNITGLYNLASADAKSKYQLGLLVCQKFGFNCASIKEMKAVPQFESGITRNLTLGLDVSKIENVLGIAMPKIKESVNSLYKQYCLLDHEKVVL